MKKSLSLHPRPCRHNKGLPVAVRSGPPPDERSLIERSCKGDVHAYDVLVRRYERVMFQLAVRLTGNSDDAADIAQEAFIRGWNHIKAFRREAMFSTWMHRIVVNVFLDNRKKNRNKKHISLEQSIDASQEATTMDIPDTAAGPEALALESEQQALLHNALMDLPEAQRTLMVLFHIQEKTYEELVEITGLPLGTVKSRLNRARLAMRDRLGKRNAES
jgi:RNA polymerase sigma-70 factor (ECF subfamily)